MKDPYRYFRIEARDLVDGLSQGILELEGDPHSREPIAQRLLRLAHTLKGAARVVGQAEIAEEAHALEDAVAARRGEGGVDDLLAHVDAISARLSELAPSPEVPLSPRLPAEGEALAQGAGAEAGAPSAASPVDLDALDLLLETLQDARGRLGALRRAADRVGALAARAAAKPGAELSAALGGAAHELGAALASLDGDLQRLGVHAHDLRLVPASSIFAQLERAARDAAHELGKRVIFEARGGDHHLDDRVLSLVRDALLHIVRNAVDHGIEAAAEREAQGKPPAGKIEIDVAREGYRITFSCRDDGRGIDVEAVRRSAAERAIEPRDDPKSLVFEPGVSTRSEVTAISGRGVGLDVAHDIAARLKGDVSVESEPGRGAAFSITTPVSLSSMPVLAVEAGELRAAIPLDAVRRALRLEPGDVVCVGDREVIAVDGRALPFLRLDAWADAEPEGSRSIAEPRSAVVIATEAGVAAVGVDRLLGTAHAIIQPLPAIAGAVPMLGASLDLDGIPEPVIEPAALIAAAAATRSPPHALAKAPKAVLVIDDSLTTRMLEQAVLEAAGYRVDVASSGEEALEKARVEPYDLFVVDVEMPGMDGFQFVARTREDPALRDVPSIIVSSRGSAVDKRRGAEAGARAYVVKEEFAEQPFLELVRGLA